MQRRRPMGAPSRGGSFGHGVEEFVPGWRGSHRVIAGHSVPGFGASDSSLGASHQQLASQLEGVLNDAARGPHELEFSKEDRCCFDGSIHLGVTCAKKAKYHKCNQGNP